MSWILVLVSGLLEVAWALGLKASHGFTRLGASVFTLVTMLASFTLLSIAVRNLPLGTAYAVWVGIGAVGTALVGMTCYGEPATVARLACLVLVVGGIVGLKLTSPA
ncbi:MAG: quaternary ammonium compound efflux SMR transporter SugE [Kofleriaceae bacterium]|nr:quaternary ammonium compound efflux SMR transporter SugE [Kofleriaceae bacterium]